MIKSNVSDLCFWFASELDSPVFVSNFNPPVQPTVNSPPPAHDAYSVMKTPGQRQLISLQERVKVGDITVDEAVQEFKAWQFDHNRRADSIRYQQVDQQYQHHWCWSLVQDWIQHVSCVCFLQENLKKLRDSIIRRHKDRRDRAGKDIGRAVWSFLIVMLLIETFCMLLMCGLVSALLDYEISAPLQRNLYWGSNRTLECAVYEPAPREVTSSPPPVAQVIQRSTWKTGSTSSTSSESRQLLSTSPICCILNCN